jgi:hypothetical protein
MVKTEDSSGRTPYAGRRTPFDNPVQAKRSAGYKNEATHPNADRRCPPATQQTRETPCGVSRLDVADIPRTALACTGLSKGVRLPAYRVRPIECLISYNFFIIQLRNNKLALKVYFLDIPMNNQKKCILNKIFLPLCAYIYYNKMFSVFNLFTL